MANTTTSLYMNLNVPIVGVDPSPQWASDVNACLSVIDGHTHNPGSGQQITPTGLNINTSLSFQSNPATNLSSTGFTSLTVSPSLLSSVYVYLGDLWYSNAGGTAVRLTNGSSPAGTAGSITGLPSGTAAVTFAAGNYTFTNATLTPAPIIAGPLSIGTVTSNPNFITLASASALAANFTLTLPPALAVPVAGSTSYLTSDASGNINYNNAGSSGTGAVVLATSATLTSPTFVTPALGTPASGVATNITGLVLGASGGNVASGVLSVTNGGSGLAAVTLNTIPYGAGTSALSLVAVSSLANQVLTTASAGGAPSWGPVLAYGTYAPTIVNVAGSHSSPSTFTWTQIGTIVTVVGQVTLTMSSGTAEGTISLPTSITSNFSSTNQVTGIMSLTGNTAYTSSAYVNASSGAQTAFYQLGVNGGATSSCTVYITFTYNTAN